MAVILIVEDELELVKVLRSYLENAGFSVLATGRGDQGLSMWQEKHPDLVLLDLNLPGMDGLEIARTIRRQGDTPIIMVTARVDEIDRLIGLELGADDYISKPFSPREVVARVKTVLRRAGVGNTPSQIIRIADLEIDPEAFSVLRAGQPLEFTPTEFTILVTLASSPGRVYNRLQLLEATQGSAYEGYERTVDAHIKNLRSKLEPDPRNPQYIETVFGVGYRFARS
jgi:DNA-binding response OmpR family regulator